MIQRSSSGPRSPAGCMKIMFFIGLPVKSISRTWSSSNARWAAPAPIRTHELAAHDAGEHVPIQEEGKAAEHLALGHLGVGGHDLAGAVGDPGGAPGRAGGPGRDGR